MARPSNSYFGRCWSKASSSRSRAQAQTLARGSILKYWKAVATPSNFYFGQCWSEASPSMGPVLVYSTSIGPVLLDFTSKRSFCMINHSFSLDGACRWVLGGSVGGCCLRVLVSRCWWQAAAMYAKTRCMCAGGHVSKVTRGGTRTRNLLLRREAPYPLGHTSRYL